MCWGLTRGGKRRLDRNRIDAFQEEELVFLAEAEHIRYVTNMLDEHSVVVKYSEKVIAPKDPFFKEHQRFAPDARLYWNVFHVAHKNHANWIIFCSDKSWPNFNQSTAQEL